MTQLSVGELIIDVGRKSIKNLHLGVYPPDGRVRVASPLHLSDDSVRLFVTSQIPWIRNVLTEWYRHQLKAAIPDLIDKWEPIMGVDVAEWGVKQMKTKQGTCSIDVRRIWRFRALLDQFFPHWQRIRDELNEFIL